MRGWLYSAEEPAGEIFEGAEYDAKKAAGWVNNPGLVVLATPIPEPVKSKGGRPKKETA